MMQLNSFQNLSTRMITALSLIAIVGGVLLLASLFCFGRWLAVTLAVVTVGMSAYEFSSVCCTREQGRVKRLVYIAIMLIPVAVFLWFISDVGICEVIPFRAETASCMVVGSVLFSFLAGLAYLIYCGSQSLDRSGEVARELFPGIVLIALGGGSLLSILMFADSVRILLWIILVVAVNDSSAYLFGTKIGGPRLAPIISPNKTISGSAAGFISGGVVGCLFSFLLPSGYSPLNMLLISVIAVFASQIGDLTKSYIKRLHAVKDTGSLLPGHGGVLDRVDGVLGASPVVLLFYLADLLLLAR